MKGDGNRYKFILRDEMQWDGMSWSNTFDTQPGRRRTEPSHTEDSHGHSSSSGELHPASSFECCLGC